MESNEPHGNYQDIGDSEDLSIHISDVIEVIRDADPDIFGNPIMNIHPQSPQIQQESPPAPYVVILEHPAPKALRFRYECEGRSAGSIPGANSTTDNKTYPTIQVMNFVGRAVVVVSCVTKDFPHKPHPHNLVGREGCKKGVCTLEINSDDMKIVFSNLGIQCVKKRDIEEALRVREEIRVDPFRTGYAHRSQPSSIDLNAVRLCFQVFLEGGQKGKFTTPLKPVVSDTIYDKKSMSDLVITKLSHCNAFCNGGQEMILLCEKVAKEDITIRFYEEVMDGWEGFAEFQHSQVHKQVAISFRTPKYRAIDISEPVRVKIQLRRPSDGATSDPLDFEMLPLNEDQNDINRRKRHRSGDDAAVLHTALKKSPAHEIGQYQPGHFRPINDQHNVKLEPREAATSPAYVFHGDYRNPAQTTPSPQPQGQSQLSPPMFVHQNSHSPNFMQGGNFQQIQQQAPRQTIQPMPEILQQPVNQNYTLNVLTTTQAQFGNNNGNNIIWNDFGNNGNNPSTSRANYAMPGQPSTIFNQPMSNATNAAQIFGMPERTESSLLMFDLDNQLVNISGELQNLSFLDESMNSFNSKTDNKQANKSTI